MQTFWGHLTFLNLGQPLLTRFRAGTLLTHPVDELDEAEALPTLDLGLEGKRGEFQSVQETLCVYPLTLMNSRHHMNHVVTRLRGDGAVVVLCMFRINFERPNFHSMSDCAWGGQSAVIIKWYEKIKTAFISLKTGKQNN